MNTKTLRPLLAILLLLVSSIAMAQKEFTLEDLNFGGTNYRNMVPQNRYTTWWGDRLVRLDVEEAYLVDKATGREQPLLSLDALNKVFGGKLHSMFYLQFPDAHKPYVMVRGGGERAIIDFKANKIVWHGSAKDELQASSFSQASHFTAYVNGDQLFVRPADGSAARQLTTDGSRDIKYGQSVHRDEFGITGGLFWSPKGNRLAFYRMDQSMVTDFPLVDIPEIDWTPSAGESRIATPAPEKYPMAGETSHKVTVGVYDIHTGNIIHLNAGDPTDRYFTNVAWSPDETTIYMFELNRDQNDCRLTAYSATTGEKIAELYRETDSKYVEPLHPIEFLPWNSHQFIFQSQKDGYNHLYLCTLSNDGKSLKGEPQQITKGQWVVMDMLGFNAKAKSIIYASNECSPIQRNTWALSLATGKRTLLDNGRGWHNASLSASGSYVADNYQEPTVPRQIDILSTTLKTKAVSYFTAPDPYKGYNTPEYSSGTLKADDGVTTLYWRMVKPVDFDPTKKYPTIVYVYGGPHAHNVDARWHYCSRGWETYMAQKGYLLFILDNRGSENRGKDFEQATFRQLGQVEMKDQMRGVEYLKTLPYVDASRLGVHGWSFGGFMTISLITNYPDVFKVGVAGGPVIDWKWYEVMYGERYMDTPQANPEGYAKTSLLAKAKDLKGKLQVIIGLNDPVVVPQHAFSFLKACIAAGTQPDFFVYPGEPHNMRGHQSVHLHERISQYFEDYLK